MCCMCRNNRRWCGWWGCGCCGNRRPSGEGAENGNNSSGGNLGSGNLGSGNNCGCGCWDICRESNRRAFREGFREGYNRGFRDGQCSSAGIVPLQESGNGFCAGGDNRSCGCN